MSTAIAVTTRYERNGYTDRSRNGNKLEPQDAPASAADVLDLLKYQTPAVQDVVIHRVAAMSDAPSISTVRALIGRARRDNPVSVGAIHSA